MIGQELDSVQRVLFIVPARAGSKGIPGKCTKLLNGIPLVEYPIRTILEAYPTATVLVTTDSPEVAEIAQKLGVEVLMRPEYLCRDEVPVMPDVLRHAHIEAEKRFGREFDTVIDMEPTAPLISYQTLRWMLRRYRMMELDVMDGVVALRGSYWHITPTEIVRLPYAGDRKNRQDVPPIYQIVNPSIFSRDMIYRPDFDHSKRRGHHVIPENEAVEIDEPKDWAVAEFYLKEREGLKAAILD